MSNKYNIKVTWNNTLGHLINLDNINDPELLKIAIRNLAASFDSILYEDSSNGKIHLSFNLLDEDAVIPHLYDEDDFQGI